jgi:hypothetical protein
VPQFLIREPAQKILQRISLDPAQGISVKPLAIYLDLDGEIEKFRGRKHWL